MSTDKERSHRHGPQRQVGVCRRGESRPFLYGKLNKQFVLMLSALEISDSNFLELQSEFFDRLSRCFDDRKAAFYILCANGKFEEARELCQIDEEIDIPKHILSQVIFNNYFERYGASEDYFIFFAYF